MIDCSCAINQLHVGEAVDTVNEQEISQNFREPQGLNTLSRLRIRGHDICMSALSLLICIRAVL